MGALKSPGTPNQQHEAQQGQEPSTSLATADEKAGKNTKLREAGRLKLEEFKRKKQLQAIQEEEQQLHERRLQLEQRPGQRAPLRPRTYSNAQQPKDLYGIPSEGLEQALVTHTPEPLLEVLMAQVDMLMRDRSNLAAHNKQLQRENAQLQELVGFLTLTAQGEQSDDESSEQTMYGGTDDLEGGDDSWDDSGDPELEQLRQEVQRLQRASCDGFGEQLELAGPGPLALGGSASGFGDEGAAAARTLMAAQG